MEKLKLFEDKFNYLTIILTISLTCGLEALDIPLISEAQYVRFLIF